MQFLNCRDIAITLIDCKNRSVFLAVDPRYFVFADDRFPVPSPHVVHTWNLLHSE